MFYYSYDFFPKLMSTQRYHLSVNRSPSAPPVGHPFFEIGYLLKGEANLFVNGHYLRAKPGDYYFADIQAEHYHQGLTETELLLFLFYPDSIHPTLASCKSFGEVLSSPVFQLSSDSKAPFQSLNRDEDGRLLQLLNMIQLEQQEKKAGHRQSIQLLIRMITIELYRNGNYDVKEFLEYTPLMQKILKVIERDLDHVTLASLAEELDYSTVHISRTFKKQTGKAFIEYLHRVRLGRACLYLISTDWPIEKVSAAVGYQNVHYFHKLFRQYLNTTPHRYRSKKGE